MSWILFVILGTLFLAYANGANDNFKGVATLFGSHTTDYKKALHWATLTTFLGSITACFLATKLIKTFSGKGLVPDSLVGDPTFIVAIILGAGLTVFVAAKAGIPISTTHSLIGALVGSGLMAIGSELHFSVLGQKFFLPLILSPFIAIALTAGLYLFFAWGRRLTGVTKTTCIWIGQKMIPVGHLGIEQGNIMSVSQIRSLEVFVDRKQAGQARAVEAYAGNILGMEAQGVLDILHFISAGAVSFARGLNDTPKIVALMIAAGVLGFKWNIALVAFAMAFGGLLGARRVAETVSHKITSMNHGQGFTANLVTSLLVIFASYLGMPVSTTHVSCGSLFGLGLVTRRARWNVIGGIFSAWALTLPVAAVLAAGCFWVLRVIGVA